jgi:hypothetical protein
VRSDDTIRELLVRSENNAGTASRQALGEPAGLAFTIAAIISDGRVGFQLPTLDLVLRRRSYCHLHGGLGFIAAFGHMRSLTIS